MPHGVQNDAPAEAVKVLTGHGPQTMSADAEHAEIMNWPAPHDVGVEHGVQVVEVVEAAKV